MIVVVILAIAADRLVLGPMRANRALEALPRLSVEEAIGATDGYDALVLLDDAEGWFLVMDPAAQAGLSIGLALATPEAGPASEQLPPVYCGGDRGHVLWAVRDAQIVAELATCGPVAMDLRSLRQAADPIRLERDLLTGDEVAILRAEVAADPRRIPVTLPPEATDLPFERVVALPWVWTGNTSQGVLAEALEVGRSALAEALADHPGAFEIEAELSPSSAPDMAGPLLSVQGRPAIADGLASVARPVYRVYCSEAACARLDELVIGGRLDPWRSAAVLDAALAGARPVSGTGPETDLPDRSALLDEAIERAPMMVLRHVVRVARLLETPPETE